MGTSSSTQPPPTVCCGNCGASRSATVAQTVTRPPCAVCGSTGIAVGLGMAEVTNTADRVGMVLRPQKPAADWRQRWRGVSEDLTAVTGTHSEQLSGTAVEAAREQMLSFYVRAYHVKDALVREAPALSLTKQAIEAAIDADPALALLADVANLAKHGNLTRVRSGGAPVFGAPQGAADSSTEGWRLEFRIAHLGDDLEAAAVARDAVAAWRRQLEAWRLL